MFGGEKKCLFSRRVEEWEMRTWHHSEVGQECWSPVSFWGWKKRCKIAASLMSKQGKSRMVGMVYILFYKLGQKINDVLLTKHFLQDLNTVLWFSKDIKKDCKRFLIITKKFFVSNGLALHCHYNKLCSPHLRHFWSSPPSNSNFYYIRAIHSNPK